MSMCRKQIKFAVIAKRAGSANLSICIVVVFYKLSYHHVTRKGNLRYRLNRDFGTG